MTALLVPGTLVAYAGQGQEAAGPTSAVAAAPPPGTPAAINGQLKVCGTKLCNRHGNPIQLRGMSTHGLQWYSQCVNDASLNALAQDWKADILRISMYIQEGGYQTNPRRFTDLVNKIIEQVTARGMYALVDWHMLDPGDPHRNLSRAKTFFTEIAQRHKNKTNILYEVANEPSGVSRHLSGRLLQRHQPAQAGRRLGPGSDQDRGQLPDEVTPQSRRRPPSLHSGAAVSRSTPAGRLSALGHAHIAPRLPSTLSGGSRVVVGVT